jgi:predicted PurR-regulated permease PerM
MLLQQQVNDINIQSLLQQTFNSAVDLTGFGFSFVGGAFNAVLNSILMLTMTFYLMLDGGNMVNNTARLFPLGYQADFRRLLRELGNVWHAYLRGQIILAFIMGIAMYLVAIILGLPNAVSARAIRRGDGVCPEHWTDDCYGARCRLRVIFDL